MGDATLRNQICFLLVGTRWERGRGAVIQIEEYLAARKRRGLLWKRVK